MQPDQSQPTRSAAPLVFLCGGSALNETATILAKHIPATYIITTFDSGGSTRTLRKALPIPAVGDIRSRLVALADTSQPDIAALSAVLHCRLSSSSHTETVQSQFAAITLGTHPALEEVRPDHAGKIAASLNHFATIAPPGFTWEEACIGNLVLAADYFACGKQLKPAVTRWAEILHCRGQILPVSKTPLAHLAVRLKNGQTLVGQHRFTGKWHAPITSPIEALWLARDRGRPYPMTAQIEDGVEESLTNAGAIVYPMGSFFSSVACNLLVPGVGRAIAGACGPRIFVPNPGYDPELYGTSLKDQINFLLKLLRQDAPGAPTNSLLDTVIVDRANGQYQGGIPDTWCRNLGISVLNAPLLSLARKKAATTPFPLVDGRRLARTLQKICAKPQN